ncbi:hypothetical protein [Antarcticirhabdus aurantiaca]|uniref:Uncharacterized protein n=1 Tax=Antarcticirhabdus aurantiaca TaxID=2606717 RepID=A0ACD4NTH5_9HYPH|nr:hypothetical protein [Antarcticirhabdus aurantiaca]WAJ30097.1 hypothetical protein OXU80_07795 [Jeongeuplla avenae]
MLGDIIIDSCALINIGNASVCDRIFASGAYRLHIQGLVRLESLSFEPQIAELLQRNLLQEFDGSLITASQVAAISQKYRIGVGEAECILIARQASFGILIDDKKARKAASKEGVTGEITGTLGLLCKCIDCGALTAAEAISCLKEMRDAGGFLPQFDFSSRKIIA